MYGFISSVSSTADKLIANKCRDPSSPVFINWNHCSLDLYSHVVPGLQDAVAAMLDTVLPLQRSGPE